MTTEKEENSRFSFLDNRQLNNLDYIKYISYKEMFTINVYIQIDTYI